jgi:hypothetical protein
MRRESEVVEQVVKLAENYVDGEMTRSDMRRFTNEVNQWHGKPES